MWDDKRAKRKQQIKITIQQLQNHKICHLIPHFIFLLLAAVIYSAYTAPIKAIVRPELVTLVERHTACP